MSRFQSLCEKRFHLAQNQTNLHTEVLAGLTTFATMSYVLATIPNMLSNAGLPKGAVLTALILLVMSCSIAMAVYTNRPFCLAPGMSSVAILSAVDTTGMTAEVAFGVIFIEGVIFVLISFIGLRRIVVNAIPTSVKISISAGIGLFIALIGLKSGGIIITSDNDTLVLGDNVNGTAVRDWICRVALSGGAELPRQYDRFDSDRDPVGDSARRYRSTGKHVPYARLRTAGHAPH